MPAFARPSADTFIDSWEENDGSADALYGRIDEVTADDADYVRSAVGPSNAVYVTKLTARSDPAASTGHIIRYRYSKDAPDGDLIDLTVQLREGYVDESTPGTLIHEASHTDIGSSWTDGSFTLTGGEADSITDYTSLYLRFVANTE